VAYLRSYTGIGEKQNISDPELFVTSKTSFFILAMCVGVGATVKM
jgi:hypothetical protein